MLATLARSFLSALVIVCAAVVALAVLVLRALDARGFDRAGGMLAAMGARRVPRSVRVARVEVQRAPVNRRRVRELARHAGVVLDLGDAPGWEECGACRGTGEGYGRPCGRCAGRGEVKVRTEMDIERDELAAWRFAVAG